jgi:gliding motility-associated-like protein
VFNDGEITVTGIYQGCSRSATVEVVETEYFLPPISIAEQPICSTDSTLVSSVNAYNTYSWGNYLDYPGTVYSDDTTQQSIYLSAGTFILQVTTDGGCIGQRIFNIDATDATIPEDSWSGAYCEGLEELEFCCGYASADAGNFTLYMFNTQGNWTLASLDIYVNGELILEDVQAPTPNTPLWTPGFTIYYGDFIEIYYDPGNSTGTQSLSALNCTNSPFQLFSIPLTGEGLIWSGFAACPSSPPVGYWEILDGPPGASFSDESQWNSTFTPGDYGTYNLHFFSETCDIDYFYEVVYSAPPSVSLVSEINECGEVESIVLTPEISDPVNDATLNWSTGETSDEISVNETGIYCITISNACGSEEACADVVIEPIPEIGLESDYLLCDETSVTLDPIEEDDPSYNYSWSGPGLNSTGSSAQITESGTFTLTVSNNCGSDELEFSVVLEPTPVGNDLEDSYTLCDDPSITIDPVANDDNSFGYTWSGPGGFNSSEPSETLNQSGMYTVTVANECGEVSASFEVEIIADLSVSVNSLSLCDEPSGTLVATANQGEVSFSWASGDNGSSIEVSEAGEYCVTATNVCESQQACGNVSFNFSPVVSSNLASIENLCPGIDVTLNASAGQANGVTWSWVIDCGDDDNTLQNSGSSQVITGDLATESCPDGFTVILSGSNSCGSDMTSVPVSLDACLITLPNVFSPNGDNVNDIFSIEGLENYLAFGGVSLKMFNRWGNLVFESDNYKNDWEAEGIDAGTYYYVLVLPNKTEEKGAITIVK